MTWLVIVIIGLPFIYWSGKLFLLYAQIRGQSIFWDKWNRIEATNQHLLYVALGDSTAQGIGGGTPSNSYPFLIKKWLEDKTGRSIQLINLSVSGAKVADCLRDQLPRMGVVKPAVVTIEIGANDMKSFEAVVFAKAFRELLRQLPEGSFVSDVPSFTGRNKKLEPMVIQANAIIHKLVKKSSHTSVALYDATKNNRGFGYFAADWFHPSARAYKSWATAFEQAIDKKITDSIS